MADGQNAAKVVKHFTVKDNEQPGGLSPDYYLGSQGEYVSVKYKKNEINLQKAIDNLIEAMAPATEFNAFLGRGLQGNEPELYDTFVQRLAEEVAKRLNRNNFKLSPIVVNRGDIVKINDIVENNSNWNEIMITTVSIVNTNGANNRNIYQAIVPKELLENTNVILKKECSREERGKDRDQLAAIISGGGGPNTINEHLCTWEITQEEIRIRMLIETGLDSLSNVNNKVITYFYWR